MSMDTIMEDEDSFVSNTNAIIYAASDISGWTHSLISDNNIPNSSSSTSVDDYHQQQQISTAAGGDDGSVIVSSSSSSSSFKNNKQIDDHPNTRIFGVDFKAFCNNNCGGSEFPGGLLPDTYQEAGVRVFNTLMACAKAIQENNLSAADVLISDLRRLTVSQIGGAMKKMANYFAEALDHKIHRTDPQGMVESFYTTDQRLPTSFYESWQLLKFFHITANQSILEAFADSKRVHVIDFSLNQGSQWPALLWALALRPAGPPAFRLSAISSQPKSDNGSDPVQEVGLKLAQFAESFGVEFEFCGFIVHNLADLEASMLNIRPTNAEAVAVNSVFELHRLFCIPEAFEKVLDLIKQIQPKIVTIAEQEANHNECVFVNRIREAWHYYSTMFDLLEKDLFYRSTPDLVMEQLGQEIYNLVACEGTKRVVRHETLDQWRARFNLVPLASTTYMLISTHSNGKGYQVEVNDGCLMLSWHSRPVMAISAWRYVAVQGASQ